MKGAPETVQRYLSEVPAGYEDVYLFPSIRYCILRNIVLHVMRYSLP
jgi:hypothetical protein